MIYNLKEWLDSQGLNSRVYVNEYKIIFPETIVPERKILLKETGGISTPWFGLVSRNITVYVTEKDTPKARELAYDVYSKLAFGGEGRWGLILPSVAVDGNVFSAIQTLQIKAATEPQSTGENANGISQFITNYEIIYRFRRLT